MPHVPVCVSPAVKAYLRKGQLHLAMKDTFRASEAYSKALELDPNCSVSGWTCSLDPAWPTNQNPRPSGGQGRLAEVHDER